MPTGVLEWVVSTLPFLVVPFVLGVEGNALLRALFNLTLPALHAFVAVSAFALPALCARARPDAWTARCGASSAARRSSSSGSYALCSGPAARGCSATLYGGKYVATGVELWLLGAYPLVVGLGGVFTASLRASERPRSVFWARVVAIALGAPRP